MNKLTNRDEYGNAKIVGIHSPTLYGGLNFEETNTLTDALNRLAELEDKLENGELIEVKPLNMPTWEEVQEIVRLSVDEEVEIKCNYCKLYIYKNDITFYMGAYAESFDYLKYDYDLLCNEVKERRNKLIKELCNI